MRGDFSDYDRIILHHVVTVTALELVKKKAVAETEKRLAGDFFDELIASDLYEEEIARRLAFFGLDPEAEHLIMLVDIDDFKAFVDGDTRARRRSFRTSRSACTGRSTSSSPSARFSSSRRRAATPWSCLVQLGEGVRADGVIGSAGELQRAIESMLPEITVSIGIGRPHKSLVDLRQSYYEAPTRSGSASSRATGPSSPASTTWAPTACCSGLQDTLSLEVFYDSVLGKLHEYDEQNSSDLVKSLACFLEANGHWGEAAERLYVHRHTLRYRMKRVEEITGRDLSTSQDRMEFWLALKAKELIDQSGKKQKVAAKD